MALGWIEVLSVFRRFLRHRSAGDPLSAPRHCCPIITCGNILQLDLVVWQMPPIELVMYVWKAAACAISKLRPVGFLKIEVRPARRIV